MLSTESTDARLCDFKFAGLGGRPGGLFSSSSSLTNSNLCRSASALKDSSAKTSRRKAWSPGRIRVMASKQSKNKVIHTTIPPEITTNVSFKTATTNWTNQLELNVKYRPEARRITNLV